MCGIFGVISRRSSRISQALTIGTGSLAHRGPDDSGEKLILFRSSPDLCVGLGSRRLAIQDLSPAGHQPMQDSATSNWVVFNGEIYKFREIRDELERLGHQFCSTGDTEVLLKAYSEWGEACLEKLRGMFAFAVWDAGRERLFLARDPLGVKPLYYAEVPSGLVFGSEVRALLKCGLVAPRLDQAAIASYLAFGAIQEPLTIVESVCSVPAGCALMWHEGRSTIRRYWALAEVAAREPESDDPDEVGQRIRQLLLESVTLRLISDVPVGLFLSGGIDSSSVLALATQAAREPLDTFSVIFDEQEYDESHFAELVAKRLGSRHHAIHLSQAQLLQQLPEAVASMDQPSIDGLNAYVVSKATRAAGVKVALSGIGGDELFAGYSTFRLVPQMAAYWKVTKWMSPVAKVFSSALQPIAKNSEVKILGLIAGDFFCEDPYFLSRALFLPSQAASLMGSEEFLNGRNIAFAQLQHLSREVRGLDRIQAVSVLEASAYMENMLLRDTDAMSMAHGLEVRNPILDCRLWEFVLPLKQTLKVRRERPKPLLLQAVLDEIPATVYQRAKRGFQFPFQDWMRSALRPEIEKTLAPDGKSHNWFLNSGAVSRVWESFLQGRTTWSRPWALFILKRWIGHNLRYTV
jgi:asparagine synthase (glutamine-hydrolysing)